MEFKQFVRRPFMVEAIEVTKENLEEVAQGVGKVKIDERGRSYIFIDRKVVPNVYNVWPGYWMTKMTDQTGDKIRFYSRKAFRKQFMESNEDLENLISHIDANTELEIEAPRQDQNATSISEANTGLVTFNDGDEVVVETGVIGHHSFG